MWYQFFLENLHFAINLGAALVFFAVFWLYFDAWLGRKTLKDTVRVIGFFLLSLSFIVSATHIESTIVSSSAFTNAIYQIALFITRFFGYCFVILSLVIDPLMSKPGAKKSKLNIIMPFGFVSLPLISFTVFAYPILASLTGFFYLKRSTVGLEDHLKPVGFTFFVLSLAELLSLGFLLQNTNNSTLYSIVSPFGPLWIIQLVVLFISLLILQKWVVGYLLKRFQSQLFMVFVSMIVGIFLITTVAFTTLLLRNLENDALLHLEIDVNVLQYSIDSKKAEALSDAQVVAQNSDVIMAISENDKKTLKSIASSILLSKKQSVLTILSKEGVVLARGDDPERVGDSLSGDALVKKAVNGESVSTTVTRDGVIAPTVSIRSAVPIKSGDETIGAVMVGTDIDNAFVDGVKSATKLDASIYADNIRSATTFVSPDGRSRWIGIKEENPQIKSAVLLKGKLFVGHANILNTSYLAAFSPLKDIDNVTVGMLFVGKEQSSLLQAAGRSIELTFLVAAILLVLSIFPAYLIARSIAKQLE